MTLPPYFREIERRLQKADWLVHNFNLEDEKAPLNPAAYLHNIHHDGVEYRASVDLNIFQYTVNCVKKRKTQEAHRNACAMLLFCRMAQIKIEPSLAIYERIDYGHGRLDEALQELALFRALDNTNPDLLAEFMLGNEDSLRSIVPFEIDKDDLSKRLTRYRRLEEWDSIYLLVLVLVRIYYDHDIEPTRCMAKYIEWTIRHFRLSRPCLVFAARFFGETPRSKMMKFKPSRSPADNRAGLRNMTWDLYQVNHYFRNWANPENDWEEILFTQDDVLRDSLRAAIKMQQLNNLDPLLSMLRRREAPECRELLETYRSRSDRAYRSKHWSASYRASLIEQLEMELGLR